MATPVHRRQLGPFAVRSTEILIAEGGEEHHTLRRSAGSPRGCSTGPPSRCWSSPAAVRPASADARL
jgi:hypothetical protein